MAANGHVRAGVRRGVRISPTIMQAISAPRCDAKSRNTLSATHRKRGGPACPTATGQGSMFQRR